MQYLRVKNWEEHQHYKDRNPPWIKLHRKVLDDRGFMQMPMDKKGLLMCLWVLAAEDDGNIPYDEEELRFRLRVPDLEIGEVDFLVECGFLVEAEEKQQFESPWPSRYIKPEHKQKAMERAKHACVFCGSKENLEYDHIVPISQGGNSNLENIQVLCRSCNRKKRAYVASATQKNPLLRTQAPETETETETEKEKPLGIEESFDRFWKAYPKKKSKGQALKAWKKIRPSEQLVATMIAKIEQAKTSPDWKKENGQFIPYPATWLNGMGWEDEIETSEESLHPSHRILTRTDDD